MSFLQRRIQCWTLGDIIVFSFKKFLNTIAFYRKHCCSESNEPPRSAPVRLRTTQTYGFKVKSNVMFLTPSTTNIHRHKCEAKIGTKMRKSTLHLKRFPPPMVSICHSKISIKCFAWRRQFFPRRWLSVDFHELTITGFSTGLKTGLDRVTRCFHCAVFNYEATRL